MIWFLIDAVFSNEFTAVAGESESNVQRLSFYSLYKSIQNKRDENCDQLRDQLSQKDSE